MSHDRRRAATRAVGVRRADLRRVGIARLVAAVKARVARQKGSSGSCIHADVPQWQTDAAECCYQCVCLARDDRDAGWTLLRLRGAKLSWAECLAVLRADR